MTDAQIRRAFELLGFYGRVGLRRISAVRRIERIVRREEREAIRDCGDCMIEYSCPKHRAPGEYP